MGVAAAKWRISDHRLRHAGGICLTTLSKWFVERRGIVISVAAMGVSFGGVVLTPLATWLVDMVGWREAWLWLGLSATALLPVALVMRRAP